MHPPADRIRERGRSRGSGFAWVSLGVLLVLGAGVVSLAVRANADPAYATYAERLRLPPRVMPADPVPQLSDLWIQSFLDPTLEGVTFYSRNRPLVTVCLGDEPTCRSSLGLSEVLRSERSGPNIVTIGVVNPGSVDKLGPDLLSYWKTVPLVAITLAPPSHPAWMDEETVYQR